MRKIVFISCFVLFVLSFSSCSLANLLNSEYITEFTTKEADNIKVTPPHNNPDRLEVNKAVYSAMLTIDSYRKTFELDTTSNHNKGKVISAQGSYIGDFNKDNKIILRSNPPLFKDEDISTFEVSIHRDNDNNIEYLSLSHCFWFIENDDNEVFDYNDYLKSEGSVKFYKAL